MNISNRQIKLCVALITLNTVTSSVFSQQKSEMPNVSVSDEMSWIYQLYTIDPGLPSSGLNFSRAGDIICTLGDINGDGFGDWAIGKSSAVDYVTGSQTGAIHIYFGSDSFQSTETPADLVVRGGLTEAIALDIRKAGDVNSDGYDDFLTYIYDSSAPLTDNTSWQLYFGGSPFNSEADLQFSKLEIHSGYPNFASHAGDINNDGYDDILLSVSTAVNGPDTAHVYLYYGGAQMDNIPDKIFTGTMRPPSNPHPGADNFTGATKAGDINQDTFGDIIVSTSQGAKLFFGAADMDTDEDVLFNDFLGAGIGTGPGVYPAGDVNSDGYDDLLFTANIANTKALICLGDKTVDIIPDVEIPVWTAETYVGLSASSIGDQDLDGFDDIIIGTSTIWPLNTSSARIFYGGNAMDSIADIVFDTPKPGNTFGTSVQGGDDFNGDGYNDILIGDKGNLSNFIDQDNDGGVSLFYGGSAMSVVADARFTGVADNEGFGHGLANVGDVNNDGMEDLVVGASSHWESNKYAGQAYLFFGGNTSNIPDLTFKPELPASDRYFGSTILKAGDLNGDNYDDVIITESMNVSIYFGGDSMDTNADYIVPVTQNKYRFSAPGDVNNDGYADILWSDVGEGVGGTSKLFYGGDNIFQDADVTIKGKTGDNLGSICEGIGDINNDGVNDFIVSVPGDDSFASGAGKVMVYFGGGAISAVADLEIPGYYSNQGFGSRDLAGYGDINNDGIHDLVISDNYFSLSPSSNEGRIYIYYGGASFDNVADVIITGEAANTQLGKKVMLLPDMNDDGYDEILTNKGHWLVGEENMVIYYGGFPIDTLSDISMPYTSDHHAFEAYQNEEQNAVYFLVGDQGNSAAGPGSGRVTVYSTKEIINQKLEAIAVAQSVTNGIGQTVIVQSNQETGFAYILYGGEPHISVEDLETAISSKKAVKKPVDQAFTDVLLSTTGLISGTYYAIVSNADESVSELGSNPIKVSQFTSKESHKKELSYKVYSYSNMIVIESSIPNPAIAQLLDITGKIVSIQDIQSGHQELKIEIAGIYILKLWQKNGVPQIYKLVIE